jgi:hypothetical protein
MRVASVVAIVAAVFVNARASSVLSLPGAERRVPTCIV